MPDVLCGGEHPEGESIEKVSRRNPTNHWPELPTCLRLQVARNILKLGNIVLSELQKFGAILRGNVTIRITFKNTLATIGLQMQSGI